MSRDLRKVIWSQELETGIKAIDLQHRRYFEILNQLLDHAIAVENQALDPHVLSESFDFLRMYVVEHFGTEEPIMREFSYPLFPAHRKQHLYFRGRIDQLFETMKEQGYSRKLMLQVNYLAVDWFVNHIKTTDRKLAGFLKLKREEGNPVARYLRSLANKIAGRGNDIKL